MKVPFFLLLIFVISGCTKFTTRMRIKPQLENENGVLISNSQTNPYKFTLNEHGDLLINYKVIFKNTLESPVNINLEKAYYQANEEQRPLACRTFQGTLKEINLKKGEQTGVECSAIITPNATNKLKLNDTDIKLVLLINKRPYSFDYRVFAEEFTR